MSESQALQALLCAQRHAIHQRSDDAVVFTQLQCSNRCFLSIYTNHAFIDLENNRYWNQPRSECRADVAERPAQGRLHPYATISYGGVGPGLDYKLKFRYHSSFRRLYIACGDKTVALPFAQAVQLLDALRFFFPNDGHGVVDELAQWIEQLERK